MAFYVGQRVVCVDDGGYALIRTGEVYTVLAVHMPWLSVSCKPSRISGSQAYRAFRFRPVVERKTSIAIFQAMLNPSDVRETV